MLKFSEARVQLIQIAENYMKTCSETSQESTETFLWYHIVNILQSRHWFKSGPVLLEQANRVVQWRHKYLSWLTSLLCYSGEGSMGMV